jgi:hypothetical protein
MLTSCLGGTFTGFVTHRTCTGCDRTKLKNLAHPPETIQQLRHEIQVTWDALTQEEIDNLIRSMPRRVTECVNLRGTHY